MLVLSRKKHQRIEIGKDIVITVLSCTSGGVKIGIEAPKAIPVVRPESQQRKAA